MEIKTISAFLTYFEKVRTRTKRVIADVPPDKLEWTYAKGKFTFGDLIRHLATIERFMYAENVQGKPSKYPGCGRDLSDGYEEVLAFMDDMHRESVAIFSQLSDADLLGKSMTPAGVRITTWKWLRLLIEHEIHHRGQIYLMLSLLGIETPPLYGMTSEEVLDKSE